MTAVRNCSTPVSEPRSSATPRASSSAHSESKAPTLTGDEGVSSAQASIEGTTRTQRPHEASEVDLCDSVRSPSVYLDRGRTMQLSTAIKSSNGRTILLDQNAPSMTTRTAGIQHSMCRFLPGQRRGKTRVNRGARIEATTLTRRFLGPATCSPASSTCIGTPFEIQSFRLAEHALWPFGRVVVERPSQNGDVVSRERNLVGVRRAVAHLFFGVPLCLTVIGILLGLGSFKMAGLAIALFGR